MTAANVIEALAQVCSEVGAIGKDRTAQAGGTYKYRGIDDVLNALHDPLAKAGVVIVPRIVKAENVDRPNYGKNGAYEAQMLIEYRIFGPGGREDFIDASVFATGFDTGDKGTGKAMSYAYKQLAFQLFCIPTDAAEDNEATHVERTARKPEPQWDEARWKRLAADLKALPDKAKDAVVDEMTAKRLFANRRPNLPFTDGDLDLLALLIEEAQIVTPTADHSDRAIKVMAEATGFDDPLNPPEGSDIKDWMWDLAEVEGLDAHDWKITAKAAGLRQADLLDMAQGVAQDLGATDPDRITDIHGQVAVELRNKLISGASPF